MKPPHENAEGVIAQLSQEEGERNVATAICVQLAGRAIIRVVSRCEEAQDNCNLGTVFTRLIAITFFLINIFEPDKIWLEEET